MQIKTLMIKLNNGKELKIKEKRYRIILYKITIQYKNLLRKYKIKELTHASNEN